MGDVIQFRRPPSGTALSVRHMRGTVQVLPLEGGGYEVGHESASGGSWGNFRGPFATWHEAAAAAYALNREEYGGRCEVHTGAGR